MLHAYSYTCNALTSSTTVTRLAGMLQEIAWVCVCTSPQPKPMQLDAIDEGTGTRDRTKRSTTATFFTYCTLLTDLEASCSSNIRTNALIVRCCVGSLLVCLDCNRTANEMSRGHYFCRTIGWCE